MRVSCAFDAAANSSRVQDASNAHETRMNYRHAYHAGNFADVHKHVALVAVLLHLRKKETPFAVIDTHAGRGLYDLAADESVRTRESEAGVARLARPSSALPALQTYLDIVRSFGVGRYPGSPLIAAS